MKNMKRILVCLFAVMLAALLLAGCGGDSQTQTSAPAQTQVLTETESEAVEETEAQTDSGAAAEMETETMAVTDTEEAGLSVEEDGTYTSKEEVALYIHTYGKLPSNFVTKKEAQAAGWDNKKGNLQDVIPGASIGGDRFGNYEGILPDKKGRKYYECDIDYEGGYRGGKRIVFSNDGLIFYTEDHYESFETLYE